MVKYENKSTNTLNLSLAKQWMKKNILEYLGKICTGQVFSKGIKITPQIHIRKFEEQTA